MRLFLILIALLGITINVFGQHEVKFKVEELSKPEFLLPTSGYSRLYKELILSDVNMSPYQLEKDSIDFPFNIIAKSNAPDSLVIFGYHSFFNGMYRAYADHRPFVISPDMIWLLISQGFARHVSANAEMLRKEFVDFDGKLSLIVRDDDLKLDSPASSWEEIFPEFTKQIAKHTGNDLINVLTSDFSTTTPVEKIASEITIMEAMESYFEFVVMRIVCGIPEITLKGTTEDWQKIYDKTKKLEKYDLKWWTDELEPILKEFIKTSKGKIDKDFWRNMFKYHSEGKCGSPEIIDGWIVKFFPYDKKGKRNNLKQLNGGGNLPEEIVKVDLTYIEVFRDTTLTTPLELWAGFIGLEQNSNDFTLSPKIGWMIRKKDTVNFGLKYKFEKLVKEDFERYGKTTRVQEKPNEIVGHKEIKNLDIPYTESILIPVKSKNVRIEEIIGARIEDLFGGIRIRVQEIPDELFGVKEIRNLDISFTDSILVSDKLKDIKIGRLSLSGKIDKSEIERISKMFPDTELIINGEKINAH